MESNKEIVTKIIEDLKLPFSTHYSAKITKEKLIEYWSEYRKESGYTFYGYAVPSGLSRSYSNLFNQYNKNGTNESWCSFILRNNGYKYCSKCEALHELEIFHKDKSKVSGLDSVCKNCRSSYYVDNKEKRQKYDKAWAHNNRDKKNAATKFYQAAKLNRTPSWSSKEDEEKIKDLYTKAQELEKETGIKYHVDHEIPLRGKLVSGLHVVNNLQVILATENLSKNNKYEIG